MSQMIPQQTMDVLRQFNDLSVQLYGIDCDLYIPSNPDDIDPNDVYSKTQDYQFTKYRSKVFIEWSPNQSRLRKLGLFTEKDLPVIAWFSNVWDPDGSDPIDIDIIRNSWFKVDVGYIPDKIDSDSFEIVDVLVKGMHDSVALQGYKIAPRRVKK